MGMIGPLVSAGSQIAGGIAARRAGGMNQQMKNDQADYVDSKTAADVGAHRRKFDRFRGSLRADIAAFGGSSSSGTGLLMAQEAERRAKLDELNVITDGKNRATTLRNGGALDMYEGKAMATQKILGGLGTAIKGFSDQMS